MKRLRLLLIVSLVVFSLLFISANTYVVDVYFIVPDPVFQVNESIGLKGWLYMTNYTTDNSTIITNYSAFSGAIINISVRDTNTTDAIFYSNYTLITDANGSFYSRTSYNNSATQIQAPNSSGDYYIRAEYKDANNITWYSDVAITVVNQTVDYFRVSSDKAEYNPSDTVLVEVEAIRNVGDMIFHVANVTVNGTLRNATKTMIANSAFNCTTGVNGRCVATLTAPSTYGDYILEINNFKAVGAFSVVPFGANVYMKDDVGQSLKNIYAVGEQARVEVSVLNASTIDTYTFSGYIKDSSENVVKTITSTTLNSNNSFTNSFLFTVDSLTFSYGSYTAYVTITKTGDGSISHTTSFEVRDWALSVNKREVNSSFEYGNSVFPNRTMNFEIYPTYRANGTVIANISNTSFSVQLKDNLNNIISTSNVTWNSSCGNEGCYQFFINSTPYVGESYLHVTLSYGGVIRTETKVVNVIGGVMSAQSTNVDGDLKELFGTNEYVYLSLSSYNLTSTNATLSDAEVFVIEYMNGSEFTYSQVNNFTAVNSSNSNYEWAWNSTLQRIKLDVPKVGGLYHAYLFGKNKTLATTAKFIVNPYSVCSVPKDTPGQAGGSTGYYYVWQFKTTDTVYFELKLIQADNPLGRATVSNITSGNGTGLGSQCNVDTSTQQVVTNATITIAEVKNVDSGSIQSLNESESTCNSDNANGGYTCTIKPFDKWEGGQQIVKFNIVGQDGTRAVAYGRFEARAFYLYGWSSTWQHSPSSNVSLSVQLYEAGSNWWGNYGSGGLSGTVALKKVEYMGRDGEWLWPPVDSGYNSSNVNSTSVTSGQGTMNLPVVNTKDGSWKTGYYRAVLQGTTSSGDVDYGYAWFGVKLWDVYGQPIECTNSSCTYKNYFNSRENISLYVKISEAGSYNYYDSGGSSLGGNVTVTVKKIEDCRKWPCKELDASNYSASTIIVNESSPWYWNANVTSHNNYILQINTTTGSWGTGYYSVVLDVNGTDTGYAWFNTIAFYVSVRGTDPGGINYKHSIKPDEAMYYNITTTKDYKGWNAIYNSSDLINTTLSDIVLRTWNESGWESLEYNYPEDINISSTSINGSMVVNLTFNSGNWPSGYYWGELTLLNSGSEASTGHLYFNARPFRVSVSNSGNYETDSDQCINASLNVYEPSWYNNTLSYGNYSITSVYENVWSGMSSSRTTYTNYTNVSFNATTNVTFCPNNGSWGTGNWGGYHSLNIIVQDNSNNNTQSGWLSFRTVPFQIKWGTVSNTLIGEDVNVQINVTTYSTGENTTGNLTEVYQWRYDNYMSSRESYVFSVGNCFSNVSGECTVNGTQNITIYSPSGGWKVGYNYLQTKWTKADDSSSLVEDWGGINFEGREAYNGFYTNSDLNGWWKYNFANNENITIKITVRDNNYAVKNVTITNVWYAPQSDGCWDDWCRSYTAATWSLHNETESTTGIDGQAIINIQVPSTNWSVLGYYYIKAAVSGSNGTATIINGELRITDTNAPNVTIVAPILNSTITGATFDINATTNENADCWISVKEYSGFYGWYCAGYNASNSSNSSAQLLEACNVTAYGFNNNTGDHYYTYIADDYFSTSSGSNYDYAYRSGTTGLVTGGTTHGYTFNTTNLVNNSALVDQDYGIHIQCSDDDSNSGQGYTVVHINVTG